MKTIDRARALFDKHKNEIIPDGAAEFISCGLVGEGSECFGFDDEISADHDLDDGFCIWIDDSAYKELFPAVSAAYCSIDTGAKNAISSGAQRRKGVFSCSEFYRGLIGLDRAPSGVREWLSIPDHALSCATNGTLFTDNATDFTYLRNILKNGVPRDIWLKKLARSTVLAAQSGQYNYLRCVRHGEKGASRLALAEFVTHAAECVYYLNGGYPPFYKWLLRGIKELPTLSELGHDFSALLLSTSVSECVDGIESISSRLIREMRSRGLTEGNDSFLEPHAYRIKEKILDPELKAMHVME